MTSTTTTVKALGDVMRRVLMVPPRFFTVQVFWGKID
jgi:hypothetical protein